jgi:hypothetical protein
MQTAALDVAGRTNPDFLNLGAGASILFEFHINPTIFGTILGDVSGLTLAPGLYSWTTALIIPTDVTISGSSTDSTSQILIPIIRVIVKGKLLTSLDFPSLRHTHNVKLEANYASWRCGSA